MTSESITLKDLFANDPDLCEACGLYLHKVAVGRGYRSATTRAEIIAWLRENVTPSSTEDELWFVPPLFDHVAFVREEDAVAFKLWRGQ